MRLPSYFKTVFAFIFAVFSLMAASYVLPSMLLTRGVPAREVGVIISAFFIGATPGRLLGSIAVEKLGIKRTILTFSLLGAVTALAYPLGSFAVLIISRFIVGICYSIIYVAATTYQEFVIPEEERGRLYGYFCLASLLPQFVVIPLSELLIDSGAETAYLLLSTVILLIVALYTSRLKIEIAQEQRTDGAQEWGTWGELLRRRDTWSLLCSTLLLFMLGTACVQYAPNLMRLQGMKGTFYTWAQTFSGAGVRLLLCAPMLTTFDRRTSCCAWGLVASASLICAALSASVPAFVVSGILFGASNGFAYPILCALVPDMIPPHLLPKGTAVYLLLSDIPPILMPLLMGIVPESVGLAGLMMGVGAFCFVLIPPIYLFLWRRPPLFRRAAE